jgi:hypothetical protein
LSILISERTGQFFTFVILAFLILLMMLMSLRGRMWELRRLSAVDAIDEAIARSAEMDRPAMISPGTGDINAATIGETFAGLQVLSYAAGVCARLGVRPIVPIHCAPTLPLAVQMVKEAYIKEGKLEDFREDSVWFETNVTTAYESAVQGMMWRENIGTFILVGTSMAPTNTLCETAKLVGAMSIGGTTQTSGMPFIAASMDYTMIGEEIYEAGAFLSKDPLITGCISGQDLGKILALIILIIGLILFNAGINLSPFFK